MKSGNRPYIGVIGERSCNEEAGRNAFEVGKLIAEEGWILVCGGMGGVMEKACEGAASRGGVTIGVLPGGSRAEANPFLSYSIITGLGEARNSIVVRTCNALIAIAGSYGTLSEIAFANLFNIPLIGIKTWNLGRRDKQERRILTGEAQTPEEAIRMITASLREP